MVKAKRIIFTFFMASCFAITSCGTTIDLIDIAGMAVDGTLEEKAGSVKRSVESIDNATREITPEDEYYIGRTTAAIILAENELYKNQKKTKYVNNICMALVVNSEKPFIYNGYKVALLDTRDLNAISTPGGHIFISKGLYDIADSEDMLAAIIAHELAHIQLGHSSQSIKSGRVTDAVLTSLTAYGELMDKDRTESERELNEAASEFVKKSIEEGFSKDQEFKADAYAMKLLLNAGYDANAMLNLLKLLKEKQSGNTTLDRTHPSPDKRIEKVQSELKKTEYKNSTSNPQDRMARFKASR